MSLAIEHPTLFLNESIARHNIRRMAQRAQHNGVQFRPHFKTHQSAEIGDWFREYGVTAITVSSVTMAEYFARHGWTDITIAFPVNWLEIDRINALAQSITLHLLVESAATANFLAEHITAPVTIWIEVDTGYHRTGVPWDDNTALHTIADIITVAQYLTLAGLLNHAGNSYQCRDHDCIHHIYQQTITRMQSARATLSDDLTISIGDTPCCAVVDDLSQADEIRPGNFIFFDLMQQQIGACEMSEIAVVAACPVVATYPARQTIALYGGAVHLSKDVIETEAGKSYGAIAQWGESGWDVIPGTYLYSLSQEHGMVHAPESFVRDVEPGDVLLVLPVHSCLTVNLHTHYRTLDGQTIPLMSAEAIR